jgi:hypothetical protein
MKKRVLIFGIAAAVLVGLGATTGQLAWDVLRLNDADASNYIEIRPASTISSNFSLTLPSADGSADDVLVTDGAGTLSFTTGVSSGTFSGDLTLENDETISNSDDGVVDITTAGTLRNTYDAAAYADFTMADAGGLTVDVTSDGTASVDFADPVYMSGGAGTLKIFTHQDDSLADDGTVDLPDATSGFVIVSCGAESAVAVVEADGSVADVSSTTNVAYTDSDTDLCLFDDGTNVTLKNRLGEAKEIRITYFYN